MTFYAVSHPKGRRAGLAFWNEADGLLYGWVPNTGRFHRNMPLTNDFRYELENTYEEVDAGWAWQAIREERGRIDERSGGWLLEEIKAEPSLSPEEVLGRPLPTARHLEVADFVAKLRAAKPGVFLDYRVYDADSAGRNRARASGHDIAKGKVKAFAGLPLQTRTIERDGGLVVQVARTA